MTLSTGKTVEILFEKTKETYENQIALLELTSLEQPDAGSMQNSGNVIWRSRQQHAPILPGWDLTGQEQDVIEETYPAILGEPSNDFIKQRVDDMRDSRFWERRAEQSGKRQASELNSVIAAAIATQGSLFYRSDVTSGYDFIAEGQAMMNERQGYKSNRCFVLNDRSMLKFSSDLAGRQTVQGRPDETWKTGQIGSNIAEFEDVMTASFLPNLVGGASPGATVTGNQSFKPEAGTVDIATGTVTNIDARSAVIPVSDSSGYNIGDKVTIGDVESVGLDDKSQTGQLMTFSVVGKPSGTSIMVYPKPIAVDDAALSVTEKAYANVNTTLTDGADVTRLNTDATAKTNLFWDKSAVEVLGGTIPGNLFGQYAGMKVLTDTLSNGLTLYMVYDGDINDMSFRYRIFTWYGVTIADSTLVGVGLTY